MCKRNFLEQQVETLGKDRARLEFIAFRSAQVLYASDDEFCWVQWIGRDDEKTRSEKFYNWRDAIDSMMTAQQEINIDE